MAISIGRLRFLCRLLCRLYPLLSGIRSNESRYPQPHWLPSGNHVWVYHFRHWHPALYSGSFLTIFSLVTRRIVCGRPGIFVTTDFYTTFYDCLGRSGYRCAAHQPGRRSQQPRNDHRPRFDQLRHLWFGWRCSARGCRH